MRTVLMVCWMLMLGGCFSNSLRRDATFFDWRDDAKQCEAKSEAVGLKASDADVAFRACMRDRGWRYTDLAPQKR